jgi:hypothetical protein
VLHPDDGHALGARRGDQADVRDDAAAAGRRGQDVVLDVDNEQRGVRPAIQGRSPARAGN